jgi:phosphinothricin acetyltransferase
VNIRPFDVSDFADVQAIYKQGIETGHATFQQTVKSWQEWDNSMLPSCRLVATENNCILGWAGLSPISSREVYAGVAEVSVYVSNKAQGKGVGQQLLAALIVESENNNVWMLQAGVFPENIASIVLHKKNGFRELGVRKNLGQMHGVWRNVVLMERRSKIVGTSNE